MVKLDGSVPSMQDHILRLSPYIFITLIGSILTFLPQTVVVLIVFGFGLWVLYLVIGVTATVMVGTGDREQALWDKIPGTTVVRDMPG